MWFAHHPRHGSDVLPPRPFQSYLILTISTQPIYWPDSLVGPLFYPHSARCIDAIVEPPVRYPSYPPPLLGSLSNPVATWRQSNVVGQWMPSTILITCLVEDFFDLIISLPWGVCFVWILWIRCCVGMSDTARPLFFCDFPSFRATPLPSKQFLALQLSNLQAIPRQDAT